MIKVSGPQMPWVLGPGPSRPMQTSTPVSLYLREKSSDFHEILYTAAYFELDERHVIKNEKVRLY